jgi:hypothetical protein
LFAQGLKAMKRDDFIAAVVSILLLVGICYVVLIKDYDDAPTNPTSGDFP